MAVTTPALDLPAHSGIGSLRDLVLAAAGRYADRPYLRPVESDLDPIAYRQLPDVLANVATLLDELDVPVGGRVGYAMTNSTLSTLLFLGAVSAGRTVVPLNPAGGSGERDFIVQHAGLAAVLADRTTELTGAAAELRVWCPADPVDAARKLSTPVTGDRAGPPAPVPGDRPAEVLYLPGESGRFNGVVLSHANLVNNSLDLAQVFGVASGARFLTVCPLFHTSGQVFTTITPLWCGGSTTAVSSSVALARFGVLVERLRPEWTLVVSSFLASVVEHGSMATGTGLAGVLCGGAKLPAALIDDFEQLTGARVFQVYGLTESTSVATCEKPDDETRSTGSAGTPVPHARVEIRDGDRPVAAGETGEICIAGPLVSPGYLHDEALTGRKLVDGWLRTGDIGYLDPHGRLFITGRVDTMFTVGGENVYPAEIESLAGEISGVERAVAVPAPHRVLGNQVVLVFEPTPGIEPRPDRWQARLKGRLSGHRLPRRWLAVAELGWDSLPGQDGAIRRDEVRRAVRDRLAMDAGTDRTPAA